MPETAPLTRDRIELEDTRAARRGLKNPQISYIG